MDSEDVGILYDEVADRFGIEFDPYLAELGTVGDLYHYILWKLGLEKRDAACLCPPTFFALRRELAGLREVDAKSISLQSRLKDLFPWWSRKSIWRKLEDAMGIEFPGLCDARGAVVWVGIFYSLVVLPLCFLGIVLFMSAVEERTSLVRLIGATAAYIAALAGLIVLPIGMNRLCQRQFPYDCRTVGDLIESLVALNPNRLRARFDPNYLGAKDTPDEVEGTGTPCTHVPAFFQIRKILAETTGHDPKSFRLDTPLVEVMGRFGRRTTWRLLGFSLGWKLPDLERSRTVVGVCILGFVAILAGNIRGISDIPLFWWLPIPYLILAYLCTIPLAVHYPKECQSVGDLARIAIELNYGRIAAEYNSLSADEVWSNLRKLVAQTADVALDDVSPETPLVDTES
jgi:hypothetical protein